MKKPLLMVFISCMVLMTGCSKDKSTAPNEPEVTLLTTATIGNDGGTVETDDFSLTVPAGAFSANTTLRLYDAGDDHSFGDDARSVVYRVTGMPEEWSTPLRLRLKFEGTLSAESYVAQGQEVEIVGGEEPMTLYDLLAAIDSSGYLLVDVPAPAGGGGFAKASGINMPTAMEDLDFVALANHYLKVEAGRYKISYPIYLIDYVDDVKAYLDAGYNAIAALGLGYEGKSWEWPMTVLIFNEFEEKAPDLFIAALLPEDNTRSPKLAFDADKMSLANLPRIKNSACWGMAMTAQAIYEEGRSNFWRPGNVWLHAAVAEWASELTEDHPQSYVPHRLLGGEMAVFNGLRAGGGSVHSTAWKHGKGICPVIKFLMNDTRFGKDGLLRCYQYIKNGDDATTALIDAVYGTENDWFPDFFRQYLQGNIYNVAADVFTKSANISGTMNTASDTVKEFSGTYPDLSAKLYRIDLDSNHLPLDANINVMIDASQTNEDYVTAQVYRLKNNKLEFVAQGLDVTVGGVKEAAQQGYDLIVCVVNASNAAPYTGSSFLELTIRVQRQLPYNWCRISVGWMSFYVQKSDGTYEWQYDQSSSWEGQGSFTGNTFTATYDGPDPYDSDIHRAGHLTVTLDPQTLNISSFSGQQTTMTFGGTIKTEASISGGAVRFNETTTIPNPYLSCVEWGSDACGTIFSFSHRYEWLPAQQWREMQSHSCSSESTVWITLWEWYGE